MFVHISVKTLIHRHHLKVLTFFIILTELDTFNQQGHIKLIKSDRKYIYNVTKDSVSNKCSKNIIRICNQLLHIILERFHMLSAIPGARPGQQDTMTNYYDNSGFW